MSINPLGTFSPFGSFSWLFIPVAIFVIGGAIAVIVISVVKSASEKRKNNASPVVSAGVSVTGKRADVRGGSGDSPVRTEYFVTFQFDSGDRYEYRVSPEIYGITAEGDYGNLTFRGTEFISFYKV